MKKATVLRSDQCGGVKGDWGNLTWYASAELGNSQEMTIGKCIIKPGCENPYHSHPNCSEILVVMEGKIKHKIEDNQDVELNPGDVITIPPDLPHNAKNISDEDAVLFIAFSSADRKSKEE